MTSAHEPSDVDRPKASVLDRARWWAADYGYALRRQLAILSPPWSLGRRRRPPRAWRRDSSALPEVVLVPGVYEHWTFLRPLGDALAKAGHRVRVVHGLGINRRPIAATAAYLGEQLTTLPVHDAGRVLVAHSKGGLVGKHLLISSGTAHEAAAEAAAGGDPAEAAADAAPALGLLGMVTVCTPFHGVRLAGLFPDPSIRAFLPGDETIVSLGRDTSVNGRIVSVFGPFDPHIPEGSALDGATNVLVPAPGHFRVLKAPATHQAVVEGVAHLAQR
ncbi:MULTISPECIES: esterase/lipase family protein [Microbacterium]|uniref:Alpha/beta hydrolase n=1 Tax=Microbacterium marmarense TaxID=3122051 RepID=A0ABU8LSV5_9MICO